MIRYKYPNEDWQEIEGDNYTTEEADGVCEHANVLATSFFKITIYAGAGYLISNAVREIPGHIGAGYSGFSFTDDLVTVDFTNLETGENVQSFYDVNTQNSSWINPYITDVTLDRFTYTLWRKERDNTWRYFAKLDPNASWASSYCTAGDCTFKVFRNGYIVLELTGSTCPLVEIVEDNQCPEGTCEVLCGNTICCYNSQGIAIKSFSNS